MQSQLGFSHFIQQADGVAISILVLLVLFSIGSWYLIVSRGIQAFREHKATQGFLASFRAATDMKAAAELCRTQASDNPLARTAKKAFAALERQKLIERALKQAYEDEALQTEAGMTWLATVASAAPFIGLFGTVWGIYHALMAIGISGQGTLDKVAGPVGEALIMTAIGLGVAIPAAIAYNTLGRWNRRTLARLDSFAQDLLSDLEGR